MTAERAAWEVVAPRLMELRAAYALHLADVAASEPWAKDKITNLAQGIKVLDRVAQQFRSVIVDQELQEHDAAKARQIASLSASQRRFAEWIGR